MINQQGAKAPCVNKHQIMNIIETRNKLVDLRKQLGITQQEMAYQMNVRQNAISLIETRDTIGWRALESYAICLDKKLDITII